MTTPKTRKVVSVNIVQAGSKPDFDIDVHTVFREELTSKYLVEEYGAGKNANINTFGTYGAKMALKEAAKIYNVPYDESDQATKLFPEPIEGKNMSLKDVFNTEHPRYDEAEAFRLKVSNEAVWGKALKSARALEGRIKSYGVHAAGMLVCNRNLDEVIPLKYVEDKKNKTWRYVSQWSYPECESLGLLKMDYLGLNTIDLHMRAVEYIMRNGKTPPSTKEIYDGAKDDEKTFQLLRTGNTIGVFQLENSGMQDLLRRTAPTEISDIVAIIALYRPGPLGANAHIMFADRKAGRLEKGVPIHPDFAGSPLEDILSETQNVIVYQEQVMQISNRVCGMTLQEGDDLRRVMAKKKTALMNKMKPKFIGGGQKNGYSLEAMEKLWETIAHFSLYAFNKSHSVAYGYLTYASAFLKANYPVEFMASVLAQNLGEEDKVLKLLNEINRMGITVGTVDVNRSETDITPDFSTNPTSDILYGFNGVKSVSTSTGEIIVNERTSNGLFTSLEDFVKRCYQAGITNTATYQHLALAGAFDKLGVNRKTAYDSIPNLVASEKNRNKKYGGSDSLFDMFATEADNTETNNSLLNHSDEYPFIEKLAYEADMMGTYLTGHPMEKLERQEINTLGGNTLLEVSEEMANPGDYRKTFTVVGVVSTLEQRNGKRRSIIATLNDGHSFLPLYLSSNLVERITVWEAIEDIRKQYMNGEKGVVSSSLIKASTKPNVEPLPMLNKQTVYRFTITVSQSNRGRVFASINNYEPIVLANNGKLPIRLRFNFRGDKENKAKVWARMKKTPTYIAEKSPGDKPIMVAPYSLETNYNINKSFNLVSKGNIMDAVQYIENPDLVHDSTTTRWLPISLHEDTEYETNINNWLDYVNNMSYTDTGLTASGDENTNIVLQKVMESYYDYDFGRYINS